MIEKITLQLLSYLYRKLRARIKKSAPFPDVEVVEGTLGINETTLVLASNIVDQNSQLEFYVSKPNVGRPYKIVIMDSVKTTTEDVNGNPVISREPGSLVLSFPPQAEPLKCRVIISNETE